MSELISQIKFVNAAKTEIHLEEKVSGENSVTKIKRVFESDDLRHPEFTNIQHEIMPWIKKTFKVDDKRDITFKSLHLNRDDHNSIQVTVFERWEGIAGGSSWTYPVMVEADIEKKNANKIVAQLQDAIVKMIDEAHKYMGGKRSQGALPLNDGEEEEEENTNQVVKTGKRK